MVVFNIVVDSNLSFIVRETDTRTYSSSLIDSLVAGPCACFGFELLTEILILYFATVL